MQFVFPSCKEIELISVCSIGIVVIGVCSIRISFTKIPQSGCQQKGFFTVMLLHIQIEQLLVIVT